MLLYIVPCINVYCKKIIYGKCANKGDNLMDNHKKIFVEGDNKMLLSSQPLTSGSVKTILFCSTKI